MHRHGAAIGTVEHSFLCQFWVKGNLPEALEVKGIKEDKASLIRQRSRCQKVRDGTYKRKANKEVTKDSKVGRKESKQKLMVVAEEVFGESCR